MAANSEHINEQVITAGNWGSILLGPLGDCVALDSESSHLRGKEAGCGKGCFVSGTPCHFQIALLLAEHRVGRGGRESLLVKSFRRSQYKVFRWMWAACGM